MSKIAELIVSDGFRVLDVSKRDDSKLPLSKDTLIIKVDRGTVIDLYSDVSECIHGIHTTMIIEFEYENMYSHVERLRFKYMPQEIMYLFINGCLQLKGETDD